MNGLARCDSKGSMSWESASIPLVAMVGGGTPTSRSGSTTATFGSSSGLRRLALTPLPESTELRVTSEPVPAVVGTATHGSPGRSIGRPAPITSRWSRGSVPEIPRTAAALATSSALPPPNPRTASQPASATSATAARTARSMAQPRLRTPRLRCRPRSVPTGWHPLGMSCGR